MSTNEHIEVYIQIRDQLQKEVDRDQKLLVEVESRHKRNMKELDHLNQLIDMGSGGEQENDAKKIEEYIVDILKASSRPMHVREIYERLIENKIPIPGKGRLENVVSRISRAKNLFARDGKGTYVVKEEKEDL